MQRTRPRAYVVHEVSVLPPLPRPARIAAVDRRSGDVLFPNRKARDFTHSAVVETDQPLEEWTKPAAPAGGEERCRVTLDSPQRVVVEAELAEAGLLVLSDAWYPGWRATVTAGGSHQPTPIYRTNRVLRGIWLPAGKQTVEFRFEPTSFYRGAMLSAASWLLLAILALASLRARRVV
jgi:hypothetical protein